MNLKGNKISKIGIKKIIEYAKFNRNIISIDIRENIGVNKKNS